jgi:hypothetical protein
VDNSAADPDEVREAIRAAIARIRQRFRESASSVEADLAVIKKAHDEAEEAKKS